MMKIKYTGPMTAVQVAPYGLHKAGEVKDYPDAFGKELIDTSTRQKFEVVSVGQKPARKPAKKGDKK